MKALVHPSTILGISLALFGCASEPKYEYSKDGASEYDRTSALSDCTYQIRLNKVKESEAQELLTLCMQGKGYRYVRQP